MVNLVLIEKDETPLEQLLLERSQFLLFHKYQGAEHHVQNIGS